MQDCHGTLKISAEGVEYVSSELKDNRKLAFDAIRALEIKSPTKIAILTYEDQKRWAGKDKTFEFTLIGKKAEPMSLRHSYWIMSIGQCSCRSFRKSWRSPHLK